jgi:ubiquinone/menaquinone biosynthesis C-methylase UbiE
MREHQPRLKQTSAGIGELILGYRKAKILLTAARLDCFSHLQAPRSANSLARKLALDPRATEILLDALVAMDYLRKSRGLYRNTLISQKCLVQNSMNYMGSNLKYQDILWNAWGDLRGCVRKGGALRPLEHWLLKEKGFTNEYIRGMQNIAKKPAEEIASCVDASKAETMLDIGAGPGTYTLAFLAKNPGLRVTLLDLPGTLKVTRKLLKEQPPALARRIRLSPGNYRTDSFGKNAYDLILLSHITHDESPKVNRALIAKSFRALRPGGCIVIHDFMLEKNRTQPEFGALFSVHMLIYTEAGRTYTRDEYAAWLKNEGFKNLRQRPVAANASNSSHIITAIK